MITPKSTQKDLQDQHKQLYITKIVVPISILTDELIKCKNAKNFSRKNKGKTTGDLTKIAPDVIALLAHTNSQ